MELEKNIVGKSSRWILLSVDNDLGMISVACDDGSISIFSHDETYIYEWKTDNLKILHFLRGKGILVGISNQCDLHVWYIKTDCSLFDYKYHGPQRNMGAPISCLHFCDQLSRDASSILVGDENGDIQWIVIANNQIIGSDSIRTTDFVHSKQRIYQIQELGFENGKFTGLLLMNQELYKFTCNIKWVFGENLDIIGMKIENVHFTSFYNAARNIFHMEVVNDDMIILCTHSGKYGICTYSRSDDMDIIGDYIFPYGPFPCNVIRKCLTLRSNEIKGQICVFSGGMPAVTYRHLNAISVSVDGEPEICFTFDDPVIDFSTVTNSQNGCDRILVLTASELISISHENGRWLSNINNRLSPFSKNEITGISNIIEMNIEDNRIFQNIPNEDFIETSLVRMFAISSNNNSISIWLLNSNQYLLYERIDLDGFYNININTEKRILWPKFQKCGTWKYKPRELVTVNSMKLIKDSNDSIFLLISTNRKSVLLFKILFPGREEIDEHIQSKIWTHHVSVNEESIKYNEINYRICGSKCLSLVTCVTFNDYSGSIVVDCGSNLIYFACDVCAGCINIITGKYLLVSLDVLEQIEKSKPGNHLIELFKKKLKKGKLTESPLKEKKNHEVGKIPNFRTSTSRPVCIFLWENYYKSFNLILGFNNGSVILIYFGVDENGDFNLENYFKKLDTNTSLEIMDIKVLEFERNSFTSTNYHTMNKRESGYSESFDLAQGSSLDSADRRSTGATNTNSSYNDEESVRSFKTNTALIQWFQNNSKEIKKETLLIRCDSESVKVIDYFKKKTKFKFKLNEYFMKDTPSKSPRKEVGEKLPHPKIMESRICFSDKDVYNYTYQLFLSNNFMLELHLPTLCLLRTIHFTDSNSDFRLISMTQGIVIIAENFNSNAQLKILSAQKYKMYILNERTSLPVPNESSIPVNTINEENYQIDFMKEARSSLNSLL